MKALAFRGLRLMARLLKSVSFDRHNHHELLIAACIHREGLVEDGNGSPDDAVGRGDRVAPHHAVTGKGAVAPDDRAAAQGCATPNHGLRNSVEAQGEDAC